MQLLSETIPLSLYIHIPWCVKKCPYCDFNSHTLRDNLPEEAYIARLLQDLTNELPHIQQRSIQSIFFGGGTPSLFKPQSIAQLLNEVKNLTSFAPDIEITLEANPGTIDEERFHGFKEAGVNRLSIGIQSFAPHHLTALGRIHDQALALRAAKAATAAGFTNFNLDLMYGLPQQTLEEALADLKTAISFNPTHLSWYQLTLEPNTLFYYQKPTLPDDELIEAMHHQGHSLLNEAGYQHYEISAHGKPNHFCRHNLNYWLFGDYIGIGAGAHSKMTHFQDQTIHRNWKVKNPKDYLTANSMLGDANIIQTKDLPFEFMMNALRLKQKIPLQLFIERTGLALSSIEEKLNRAVKQGLLVWKDDAIQPTTMGYRFLNDLVGMFLG